MAEDRTTNGNHLSLENEMKSATASALIFQIIQ